MSEKSKKIINLIKKYAEDDIPINPDRSISDSTKNGPIVVPPTTTITSTKSSLANQEVKEMQKAILEFANVASETDVTSLPGQKSGLQYGNQSRSLNPKSDLEVNENGSYSDTTSQDKEFLGGSDPFGKFLVKQYINPKDIVGRQYTNVDVAGEKPRESASMENASLRGIIDSIKRIGAPGSNSEKSVDGIWKNRTNNALKNIFALTSAMFSFVKDMNVNIPEADPKILDIKTLIPNNWTDLKTQQNASSVASKITPYIKQITKFFEALKTVVFKNPALLPYIDQTKSFESYDKVAVPVDMVDAKVPLSFIANKDNAYITLRELSDKDSFNSFLQRLGKDRLPVNEKAYLDAIEKELNK